MEEVLVQTHLIIKDIQDEYRIKWVGKIMDTTPLIRDGKPVFVIIGNGARVEMNSTNMKQIERVAKKMTQPKGRGAFTKDSASIYIKEIDGKETLMGVVIHNHIKTYAPMYDRVGYRK